MKTGGLVCVLLLIAGIAHAQGIESRPLAGHYFFSGKTVLDPPENEARDTQLFIDFRDEPAKELYRKLKVRPQANYCGDPALTAKSSGGILCIEDKYLNTTRCTLGINLQTLRVNGHLPC